MPLPPGWTMGLVNGRVVPVPSEDYADTVGQPGGMGQGEYDAFIHSTGGQTNADMRQAYGGRGTPENIAAQRSITPAQATQGIGRLDPTSIAGPAQVTVRGDTFGRSTAQGDTKLVTLPGGGTISVDAHATPEAIQEAVDWAVQQREGWIGGGFENMRYAPQERVRAIPPAFRGGGSDMLIDPSRGWSDQPLTPGVPRTVLRPDGTYGVDTRTLDSNSVAGGGQSAGGPGGGHNLGPTGPMPPGPTQDPNWWRAHTVPEFMALSEASLQGLPMEALALLPNEIFVKYPSLMHRLDAATIQKRNFGADFLAQSGFGPKPALPPPTLPQLVGTGAVPPNVKKALTALTPGQTPGSPNYSPTAAYTRAGVRQPSMQTVRAMSPVDQQMLGATYSTVGLSPEDVAANVENYAGLSGGQQQSYSRVGAKPRVY